MQQSLDLTRFTLRPGTEGAFLAGRDVAMQALRAQYSGLQGATLVRLESGEYLDLVQWASRDEAQRAMEGAMTIPAVAAWFTAIDEVRSMEHTDVLHVLTAGG